MTFPHSSAPAPGPAAGPSVVIADDEAHIRMIVAERFRSNGFTVFEARDGEEALEAVRTYLPSLVITDLQMPYMNGVEFCTQVAADERTSHIPAILLTARGHIVSAEDLARTIIRKTMAKPFSAKTLFENAQSVLAAAGHPLPMPRPATSSQRTITGEAA